MIKLQDFARECGVTDRAIQKHLRTYADELDGLYQRKGPNGTWLTEEACEILRSKMMKRPAAIIEEDKRVPELEARVRELEKMLTMAQQRVDAAQGRVLELQEQASRVALLEANTAHLEASRDEFKAEAAKNAQKASEEAQRAEQAVREAQELRSRLETAEASEQRLRSMGLFEFLRERKKGRQQA